MGGGSQPALNMEAGAATRNEDAVGDGGLQHAAWLWECSVARRQPPRLRNNTLPKRTEDGVGDGEKVTPSYVSSVLRRAASVNPDNAMGTRSRIPLCRLGVHPLNRAPAARVWLYWDDLEGEWAHWQMLDEGSINVLNAKQADGTLKFNHEITVPDGPWRTHTRVYWMDLQAMKQLRVHACDGVTTFTFRALAQAQLVEGDTSTEEVEGDTSTEDTALQWQFKYGLGWKNMTPRANAHILQAQSDGRTADVSITHAWKTTAGIVRSRYMIDVENHTQILVGGRKKERKLRLVHLRGLPANDGYRYTTRCKFQGDDVDGMMKEAMLKVTGMID